MTPANVDVTGTSSEALRGLADALNIGGGYSEILASALGIARTEPIVSTQALATALRRDFVASHPSVGPAATLRVTLADALSDMATLATRYGPEGPHGGILDPAQPPFGVIFTDAFQMEVEAHSNLRLVEGIDADGGKGFLSLLVDTTGPTYEDEVEFDFTDPERFRLQGIAEQLTIDLRVRLDEHSNFIASCLGEPPCQANAPGTPVSTASVWAIDPWLLEYNVADAARERYQARTFLGTYLLGAASIRIGLDGNPLGWVQYAVPFDIGSPPEDQYLWETILEVAQTALHEGPFGEVAEGDGDVAFTLDDVQVGLTGAQAVEAARPTLQAQASALSDSLLGDFRENNDPVDFFVWATDDGDPVLMFAAPTDRPPGSPYGYARPGFFSSPELAERTKVSRPSIPGIADTEHEKVVLQSQGSALYFADDSGRVYRLEVLRVHEGSLEVSLEAID
jgi:hypothetical protein